MCIFVRRVRCQSLWPSSAPLSGLPLSRFCRTLRMSGSGRTTADSPTQREWSCGDARLARPKAAIRPPNAVPVEGHWSGLKSFSACRRCSASIANPIERRVTVGSVYHGDALVKSQICAGDSRSRGRSPKESQPATTLWRSPTRQPLCTRVQPLDRSAPRTWSASEQPSGRA